LSFQPPAHRNTEQRHRQDDAADRVHFPWETRPAQRSGQGDYRTDCLDGEVPGKHRRDGKASGAGALLLAERVGELVAGRVAGELLGQRKPEGPVGFLCKILEVAEEGQADDEAEEDDGAEPQADGEDVESAGETVHGGSVLKAIFRAREQTAYVRP